MSQHLEYFESIALDLKQLRYRDDDLAQLLVRGTRYGGDWVLSASPFFDGQPTDAGVVGKIETTGVKGDASWAFQTACVWVEDACKKADLVVASSEDLRNLLPAEEREYFCNAMIFIDRLL